MHQEPSLLPALAASPRKRFEAFLRERDEPAWLIERRREAFARFQAFAWPSARDEEWRRTDIRGLRLDAFGPPASEEPTAAARALSMMLWETLSSHYATGIEHINGALARQPDPSRLGGAVFVDLNRAVKDHPELLRRYLLTEAVTPARRHLRRAARGVLDERHTALRAQGGEARCSPFQPDRPGPGGTCRPEPHARGARGRGRSHIGPRVGRSR